MPRIPFLSQGRNYNQYRTYAHANPRDCCVQSGLSASHLGDERFKAMIEFRIVRRPAPLGRAGDRKLEAFRERRSQ